MAPTVRLLLCGERLRGDDAAALLVGDRLPADVRASAEVLAVGRLDVQDLLDVPQGGAVVVADAVAGPEPGSVVVRPLADVARGGPVPHSSHGLPPEQALALAEALRGSLPRGSFVGLAGAGFELGEPPTPSVAGALDAFVEAVAREVRRLAREGDGQASAGPTSPDRSTSPER